MTSEKISIETIKSDFENYDGWVCTDKEGCNYQHGTECPGCILITEKDVAYLNKVVLADKLFQMLPKEEQDLSILSSRVSIEVLKRIQEEEAKNPLGRKTTAFHVSLGPDALNTPYEELVQTAFEVNTNPDKYPSRTIEPGEVDGHLTK